MQSVQLLAGRVGSSWRFKANCTVCSGSVPRSSWTGCWLKPVTPPWFITEVIVCVWFYTGDLWASILPPHQLLSISDAVTWARRLSRCQKGTIKDICRVHTKLFVQLSQNNENIAFPQGQVLIWFLQLPSSARSSHSNFPFHVFYLLGEIFIWHKKGDMKSKHRFKFMWRGGHTDAMKI